MTTVSNEEIIEQLEELNKLPLSDENRGKLLAAWLFCEHFTRLLKQRGFLNGTCN